LRGGSPAPRARYKSRNVLEALESAGYILWIIERLQSVFAGVAPEPRVLRNSANCPLYLLCFAVGNERGVEPALRIASHLLKKDF